MYQILAIGEVMLELAPVAAQQKAQHLSLGYAGDTYNTSVYLARQGVKVSYFTRLGDDPYSAQMLAAFDSEQIGRDSIEQAAGRTPGLYMISNDANGERHFHFWRSQSPAREMFANEQSLELLNKALANTKEAYFSGITLAILSPDARGAFLQCLREFRSNGGSVIFDNNYRPALWASQMEARQAMDDALSISDTALLTDDDAMRLWNDACPSALLERCLAAGVNEVVIKRGPNPVIMAWQIDKTQYRQKITVAVPEVTNVVDTTAAGDSFNAGFLAARNDNLTPDQAIARGIQCAAQVIQHRGAIIPKAEFRPC